MRTEVPIGDINVVGGEFSGQAAGKFAKQTPVFGVIFAARFHCPARIAMPLTVNVSDVPRTPSSIILSTDWK